MHFYPNWILQTVYRTVPYIVSVLMCKKLSTLTYTSVVDLYFVLITINVCADKDFFIPQIPKGE